MVLNIKVIYVNVYSSVYSVKLRKGNSSVTTPPKSFVNNHSPSRLDARTFDILNAIAFRGVETFHASTDAVGTVHIAAGHYAFVSVITRLTNP
jgi:hypothetical protein